MKALLSTRIGGPETLRVEDIADPVAGPGAPEPAPATTAGVRA